MPKRPDKQVGNAMRLTSRDVAIVGDVRAYTVMTRDQVQRKHAIGSIPRANAVLLRLVRAAYLSRRYQPTVVGTRRPVYFVGPCGQELLAGAPLNATRSRAQIATLSDLFLNHQLAVNEVRMRFEQLDCGSSCERWLTDLDLRNEKLGMIPDGYLEYSVAGQRFTAFVEVDLGTETMTVWREKVDAYLQLAHSGRYRTRFNRMFFRTIVVVPSAGRAIQIQQQIGSVTEQIFWLTTMDAIISNGPLAAIWRRPRDSVFHALTEP